MADKLKRLTTADVAPRVHMSRLELDAWIRSGKCPFGVYIVREGKRRGSYIIFEQRLEIFISGADIMSSWKKVSEN